jgi:hypothetical protein
VSVAVLEAQTESGMREEADVAFNQDQHGAMEPDQLRNDTPIQTPSVDESRRRFTRSGIAASGVLLTLTSRPVLGNGGGWGGGGGKPHGKCCKAPSAWTSGDKSVTGAPPVCEGRPPKYWKDRPKQWPVKCADEVFQKHFTCGSHFRYAKSTMLDVCANSHGEWLEVAELCSRLVAAYLNCKQGWTPFLKEQTVRAIFNECATKGYFSPTAGVNWTVRDCIEYLKATQEA